MSRNRSVPTTALQGMVKHAAQEMVSAQWYQRESLLRLNGANQLRKFNRESAAEFSEELQSRGDLVELDTFRVGPPETEIKIALAPFMQRFLESLLNLPALEDEADAESFLKFLLLGE